MYRSRDLQCARGVSVERFEGITFFLVERLENGLNSIGRASGEALNICQVTSNMLAPFLGRYRARDGFNKPFRMASRNKFHDMLQGNHCFHFQAQNIFSTSTIVIVLVTEDAFHPSERRINESSLGWCLGCTGFSGYTAVSSPVHIFTRIGITGHRCTSRSRNIPQTTSQEMGVGLRVLCRRS